MSATKKIITKTTLALGGSLTGLFLFLNPTGANAQSPMDPPPPFGDSGTVGSDTTGSIAGTFTDGNMVFFAWKGKSNNYIYLKYYSPDSGWSQTTQVTDLKGNKIQSYYGVDAVAVKTTSEKTQACLFFKPQGDKNTGNKIDYTCSTITYDDENKKPQFTWSTPITLVELKKENHISSISSTANDPDNAEIFHLILGFKFDNAWNGYKLRHIPCSSGGSGNVISCSDSDTTNATENQDPSILLLEEKTFSFYRFGNSNHLGYSEGITAQQDATLRDTKGHDRSTLNRNDSYYFNERTDGDDDWYIYVAYKNEDSDGIRYSKVEQAAFELDNETWTHCEFKDSNNNWLATSTQGPTLFEYNNALYILYSDSKNNGVLTYKRIDNKC